MTISKLEVGAVPLGVGGDSLRSAAAKINANFSNTTHAASRLVGTAAGNVMEVGAFGMGVTVPNGNAITSVENTAPTQITSAGMSFLAVHFKTADLYAVGLPSWSQLLIGRNSDLNLKIRGAYNGVVAETTFWGTHNATKDSNGFLKGASPVVDMYNDKIDLNHDAEQQGDITFEKLGIGNYLVKGSLGFAQEGWYIETPKDANGNVLVAVVYEQLTNNDLSIKTYAKKFDDETGDIVPNLLKPRDIPTGRFISLRLHELPKELPEMPDDTQTEQSDE